MMLRTTNNIPGDTLVIVTGGTFEKTYDKEKGELNFVDRVNGDAACEQIIRRVRALSVAIDVLMYMNSLDMTDENRRELAIRIKESSQNKLVVVHGTDTMVQSAQFVGAYLPQHANDDGKRVVFTGAMVPHCIDGSDAEFNLAFALGVASQVKPGVHIAMNARVLDPQDAYKDYTDMTFKNSRA